MIIKSTPCLVLLLPFALLSAALAADPDVLLAESRAALARPDAKKAVELAEQAVEAAPDRADLHAHLGTAYSLRIGEVNFMHQAMIAMKMRSAFEKAIALDPDLLAGRIGLARYYTFAPTIAGGGRERAEAEAAEIRQRHERLGLIEYGLIAEHYGDLPAARQWFEAAAAIEADDAGVQERLGVVTEKLGDHEQARTHYRNALKLQPDATAAQEGLARLAAQP